MEILSVETAGGVGSAAVSVSFGWLFVGAGSRGSLGGEVVKKFLAVSKILVMKVLLVRSMFVVIS